MKAEFNKAGELELTPENNAEFVLLDNHTSSDGDLSEYNGKVKINDVVTRLPIYDQPGTEGPIEYGSGAAPWLPEYKVTC